MKTGLIIRSAAFGDLHRMLEIFDLVTRAMLARGINQWDGNYPNRDIIRRDLQSRAVYVVVKDHEVIGSYSLDKVQDEQYDHIKWCFKSDKVAVMHRLAVVPNMQGYGIGKRICGHAEQMAVEMLCDTIRLDAFSGNPVSNGMYRKMGYTRADGLCYFHNNDIPFYCYEKALSL